MSTKWTPLQASLDVAHCPPEQLMATLLPYFWQYECEVEAGTHHRTGRAGFKVKHLDKDRRVRWLRLRHDDYYWDADGDVFRNPELAVVAISKAPTPGNIIAELTYGKNPATYPWWVKDQERRRGKPLPTSGDGDDLMHRSSDLVDQILSKLILMVPNEAGTEEMVAEVAKAFAAQKPVLHDMVYGALDRVCKDCSRAGPGVYGPGPTAPESLPPLAPADR